MIHAFPSWVVWIPRFSPLRKIQNPRIVELRIFWHPFHPFLHITFSSSQAFFKNFYWSFASFFLLPCCTKPRCTMLRWEWSPLFSECTKNGPVLFQTARFGCGFLEKHRRLSLYVLSIPNSHFLSICGLIWFLKVLPKTGGWKPYSSISHIPMNQYLK